MSDTMRRYSRPPTSQRSGGPDGERRELIFSDLHPAYRSLRDKSNIVSADEALCQEQKELVKRYDAQLERLFDPYKPSDDLATAIIRKERAEAVEKIRMSKRRRSNLIVELYQAQQVWEMVNKPSQEEEEELNERLEQEFEHCWKALEAERRLAAKSIKTSSSSEPLDLGDFLTAIENSLDKGPTTENRVEALSGNGESTDAEDTSLDQAKGKAPSIRSMDITSASAESESTVTQHKPPSAREIKEHQQPTTPEAIDRERPEVPMTSIGSLVNNVSGVVRASRDHMSNVLRSVGNLRQRRKKSD